MVGMVQIGLYSFGLYSIWIYLNILYHIIHDQDWFIRSTDASDGTDRQTDLFQVMTGLHIQLHFEVFFARLVEHTWSLVTTDLLPVAPQIGILSSFFLVELPNSKSQQMEQIVLSIMVFCLGEATRALKNSVLI